MPSATWSTTGLCLGMLPPADHADASARGSSWIDSSSRPSLAVTRSRVLPNCLRRASAVPPSRSGRLRARCTPGPRKSAMATSSPTSSARIASSSSRPAATSRRIVPRRHAFQPVGGAGVDAMDVTPRPTVEPPPADQLVVRHPHQQADQVGWILQVVLPEADPDEKAGQH